MSSINKFEVNGQEVLIDDSKISVLLSKTVATTIDVFWADVIKSDTDGSINDAVLNADGTVKTGFSGFKISPYIDIIDNLSYYYIPQSINSIYANICFYDKNKNIIETIVGGVLITNQKYKLIIPSKAKYIRCTYYDDKNYIYTHQRIDDLRTIKEFNDYQFVIRGDILLKNLIELETTFEDGIFEKMTGGSYITSDYIEITNESLYAYLTDTFTNSFKLIEFYDSTKKIISTIMGGANIRDKIIQLIPPLGTKYIRYAKGVYQTSSGIFKFNGAKFESQVSEVINTTFSDNNNILWVGTSIPLLATYPKNASEKCGYNCINNSLGSSQLRFTNTHPTTVEYWSGRCLTARVSELETLYRTDVANGTISEDQLEEWKDYSYERSVLPYINGTNDVQISMIVIDHGFNDRNNIHELLQSENTIDWDNRDRSNFVGAFNFLLDEIFSINPFIKVVVCGYFLNKYEPYHSADICYMLKLISEHYNIYLMPAWEHTQISNLYVPNSSEYITQFNTKYGTTYTKHDPDENGNITFLLLYCPDNVHPHTDKTGLCNKRLDAVYSKLLKDLL